MAAITNAMTTTMTTTDLNAHTVLRVSRVSLTAFNELNAEKGPIGP
jgi:hypothetical protein